jgi:mono/diheme cytochrome c family protein
MSLLRHASRVVGLGLFVAAAGCGESGSTSPPAKTPNPPAVASATQAGGGKAVFDQHCAKCHAVEGMGRKGKGPNLAHIGADPSHTPEWIAEHVRNPKSHQPSSKMPAFADKLTPDEIRTVAEYLSTLK